MVPYPFSALHAICSIMFMQARTLQPIVLLHALGSAIGMLLSSVCLSVSVCLWRSELWLKNDTSNSKCVRTHEYCPHRNTILQLYNPLLLSYPLKHPTSWIIEVGVIWKINQKHTYSSITYLRFFLYFYICILRFVYDLRLIKETVRSVYSQRQQWFLFAYAGYLSMQS